MFFKAIESSFSVDELIICLFHIKMMKIHIKVIEAKEVPKSDVLGLSDPFITISVNNKFTVCKTKFIKNCHEPKWNQQFSIDLKKPNSSVLHFNLKDHDFIFHDQLSSRDFPISQFVKDQIVEDWFEFRNKKGQSAGKVKLAFHLGDPQSKPFFVDAPVTKEIEIDDGLTPEERDNMRRTFEDFDRNQNGILEENELDQFLRRYREKEPLRTFAYYCIELYGKDGGISFDQFLQFYRDTDRDDDDPECLIRKIFNRIDDDGNGELSAQELEAVYGNLRFREGFTQEWNLRQRLTSSSYDGFKAILANDLRKMWRGQI